MKRLFISQPMSGKTTKEIVAVRDAAIASAKEKLGEDVVVIPSFFQGYEELHPLKLLSMAISKLAEADVAYFAPGWEDARGCRIEHQCAINYGIDILEDFCY